MSVHVLNDVNQITHEIVSFRSIREVSVTAEKLNQRTFLQRLLWRRDISDKIQKASKAVTTAMKDFEVDREPSSLAELY